MGGSVKRMLASSSTKRTRLGGCDEDAILSVSLRAHWKLRNLLRTSLYHTFLTFKHKAHRTLWPGDREFGAGQSCRRRLSLAPGARCGIIGAGESPREGAEAGARRSWLNSRDVRSWKEAGVVPLRRGRRAMARRLPS